MILRNSPASPFGRKIEIVARLLGLDVKVVLANVNDPGDSVRQQNPLGKIPTVILDDGAILYDSRVIAEYFDHLAGGGRIIPSDPAARFAALRLQALADGIMDASLLQVYEDRLREADRRDPKWVAYQQEKVDRALAVLEAAPPTAAPAPDIGTIAVACALGYRDLRFAGSWRAEHPRLVRFLEEFAAKVPAFAATQPA